jgi:hypothetical protein
MAAEANDSVLGYDALSRFLVRIDYPRGRLWLRRIDASVPWYGVPYQSVRDSGVLLVREGRGHRVVAVLPDSPAAELGLLANDVVLAESTEDARGLTLEQVLADVRAGRRVRVARFLNQAWIDVDLPDDPVLAPPPAD